MERVRPGFVVTGSVLLLIALLLFLYANNYRPKQAPPAEFEAHIDYPPAATPRNGPAQLSSPKEKGNKTKPHSNSNQQFHHVPPRSHASRTPTQSRALIQIKDSTPCVAQKAGFFARVLNVFKRLFGRRTNSPPIVCAVKASRSSLFHVCPPGEVSQSCELTGQEVVLNALAADADNDQLLYTWSVTGGRLSGEGRMVTWDLSGLANGTYTATVEVNDGNEHTANNSTKVTVADCECKRPPPFCPTVSVSCPTDNVYEHEKITFTANVSRGMSDMTPTYNWSVSAGTIISGQGTSTIIVDTIGLGGQTVTATVSVGGADPSCTGTTASCTTSVKSLPTVVKHEEFGYIYVNEKARLRNYAIELRKSPGSQGVIIVYGSCAGEARRRADQAKAYLVNIQRIAARRITIVEGGCRVELKTELWLVPSGATMPSPDTTGDISPCPQCDKSATPTTVKTGSATLAGRVFDENNNVIADAIVTLIGENGFRKVAKTNSNGEFALEALPAGRYDLEIDAPGFGKWRGEGLELAEGETNRLSDGTIKVSRHDVTTRFKRRDVIRIDYPDHFIDAPPGEITFNWNRTSRPGEIVTTQTNTNGQITIEKRGPDIPGGIPGEPAKTAFGSPYTAFATVTLLTDDLTVISSPATTKQSLTPEAVSWTWKVKPANKNSKRASFRFQIEVVWEGEGLPPQPPFKFYLGDPFVAEVGLPLRVKIATYGAPPSAFFGLFTFGFGFRRRKRSLTATDEAEKPPVVGGVAEEAIEEDVSCSIFAPRQASLGSDFLVQVFAHLPGEDAAALQGKAGQADPLTEPRGGDLLDQKVKRNTRLTFNLSMKGLEIDEPQQDREWTGRTIQVQFGVTVPKDFEPRSIYGLVVISADTVPIGHFRFTFQIVATPESQSDESRYLGAFKRFQCAFISYAHEDLAEVLKRVQMLSIQKKKYFQDFINIPPGDRWEPAIFQAIDKSDVIFLFWSKAASGSDWVRKEILYAVKRQENDKNALPAIYPVIIEGPPPAPPPAELNFLQFNDDFSYRIFAAEATAPHDPHDQ